MAEIDFHKGWIDFLKFIMTAFLGLLFVIFLNLMAYPDIIKNMVLTTKIFVLSVAFMSMFILLWLRIWLEHLNYLKEA